ncbi:hypothetical protein F5Y09DRAFT_354726 [Xylaria sp. FL1042]|nr:hypothetical protein F5Y09DRAFT_354726 [Xylaria sp. FL1042]
MALPIIRTSSGALLAGKRIAELPNHRHCSAKQHAAHRGQLKQVQYIKPKYAIKTEINIYKYCTKIAVKDWKLRIKRLNRKTLMNFFSSCFGLRPPNINNKPVLNVDLLCAILLYRVQPAELVDNKRKKPKDSSLKELFGIKAVILAERPGSKVERDKEDEDNTSKLGKLFLRKTIGRDRLKALCYKDILMMIVCYFMTGRAIPAISIKTIFFFTPFKTLLFCLFLLIIVLALFDDAFDADCLIDARSKESKLKIPVFRCMHCGTASQDKAMLYFKLRDDIGQQSLDIGGAANAANNSKNQLFRLFAHVSLTRDSCAKRDMVPDEIVKKYRKYYFYNRLTWDLERQAREEDVKEYIKPAIDLIISKRAQLAKLFCYQPKKLSDEEMLQRRIEVVDLYVALGGKREIVKRDRTRPRSQVELLIRTGATRPDPFPLLMQPTQCSDCISDEAQTIHERTFRYCRPTKRNDHFDDHHLEGKEYAEQEGEPIVCRHPKCSEVKLRSVDVFGNHIQSIHGITLRSSEADTKGQAQAATTC